MTHFNPIGPLNGLGSPITAPSGGSPAPEPDPLTHPFDIAIDSLGPVIFYQLDGEEWGDFDRGGSLPDLSEALDASIDIESIGSTGMTGLVSNELNSSIRSTSTPSPIPVVVGKNQTISALVKVPDDTGKGYYGILEYWACGGQPISNRRPASLRQMWMPKDQNNGLSVSWEAGGDVSSISASAGWHHVAAVISEHVDGLKSDVKVFVDGILEFDGEVDQTEPTSEAGTVVLNIGSQSFTYLGDNLITGHGISRLAVYDKSLSNQEVEDLYDATGLGS